MNNKIFISGQVSGIDYKVAKSNFDIAEKVWRNKGYEVVNPTNLCEEKWPWFVCMAVCLWYLIKCDSVYFLPNYKNSKGAMIEYKISEYMRKMMYVNNFHTPKYFN